MYKILVIGHGGFPKGIVEATELIVGKQENLFFQNLDESHDHDFLEKYIENFLSNNDNVILFADLTGGAPHKIGVRSIIKTKNKKHFVVSGAPLSFLMEILLLPLDENIDSDEVKKILTEKLKNSNQLSKVMSI